MLESVLRLKAEQLRARLEKVFARDTCSGQFDLSCPSRGHCAVAALVVQQQFGGDLVSTAEFPPSSHWFTRVEAEGLFFDIDLTGDQFGFPAVQVQSAPLYPRTRPRENSELWDETIKRAHLLSSRLEELPWT